ncbi:MAG: Hsp70 family protein, partial [Myxococcales bacterium]|nr:Hsp70 family protein [Myxococcales bacterium]
VYFDRGEDGDEAVSTSAGPGAIEHYLASDEKAGRLVQSLKSFLASRLFQSTVIFGETWRLELLVALILRPIREQAEAELGRPVTRAVCGRPVRFVNARDDSDEALALRRLEAALHNAGFTKVTFEFEPVGAAWHYERGLDEDELILIADFGGGTSDFSLMRVGPSLCREGRRAESFLGNDGVPLAGDAFDGKLIRHVVAPLLGRGAEFKSVFDRVLPVPAWIYSHLERWHHLSFLRSRKTQQLLLDLRREALEPEKLEALLHVVQRDLGFLLFRSVEAAKRALSEGEEARFQFAHEDLEIDEPVTRTDFESWIADELDAMATCVDGLLKRARLRPEHVDRVFLTGGSSLVPAVRRIFAERFGEEKLRAGGELTSVASGLALRAADPS